MHNFYKGFIKLKPNSKEAAEKYANVKLRTFEQVKNLEGYAGVLAEDAILIDLDDFGQSEKLLDIIDALEIKCRVYASTRGKHFLFKNKNGVDICDSHLKLAIGLEADIKSGVKNCYEALRVGGIDRKIIYDKLDDEEYEELPRWLYPVKSNVDFINMSEGDGRNQTLFNYILTLQTADFSKEEARKCIRIINKYILKEPLSDSELKVVLRDDAFKKDIFFKDKTFLFDKFALFLKNNNHIIKINNQLHLYEDGIYVDAYKNLEAEMIKYIPQLNRTKRTEVYTYVDLLIRENKMPSNAECIAFRNGVYNLEFNNLEDFSPNIIVTNKINYNYNPNAYSKVVDTMLNKLACNNKQIRNLLEEMIGYCFYRRNELGKAFILTGDKNNGKSTFLDMLLNLLGMNNTSALDLSELGDRFKTAELFRKLANIGDDIGDEFIANPAVFKKLATGERVNAERKGQDPFDFNNYAKLIFSANDIPRIRDKTGAVIRRLVIIPFNATFSVNDEDYDPYIKYKLRTDEAMEYLILVAIEGLKRVLKNRKFTTSDKVEKKLKEYEESNNPILIFFNETNANEIENQSTSEIYLRYSTFCSENGFQPMSNIEFSKQIKKRYGFSIINKKIKGVKYRIFVRSDELSE